MRGKYSCHTRIPPPREGMIRKNLYTIGVCPTCHTWHTDSDNILPRKRGNPSHGRGPTPFSLFLYSNSLKRYGR